MRKYILLVGLQLFGFFSFAQKDEPALIPLPRKIAWNHAVFDLARCETIYVSSADLAALINVEAMFSGKKVRTGNPPENAKDYVFLSLASVRAPYFQDEAYRLEVTAGSVILQANAAHGIFNGLQTLSQLSDDNQIAGCIIEDYPSYSWRGFMTDVGRNFQSVAQLKQQVDVMARYKLNVFHLHLTENVAWGLQVSRYPQLTLPQHMTRNKGSYYSMAEIKDLIRYCRTRYITFVPEIDMPGHSEAFTRAMGFDMQSDKGFDAIQDMLREITARYSVPYLHMGADEVGITNSRFIPTVERIIDSSGKQAIAWSPGASQEPRTIRQLWKVGVPEVDSPAYRYIDSRFLYISDMDPENTVVTIFSRKILDRDHGDDRHLGAEVCVWSDRRVASEKQLLVENAVYPAMLAFAERSWRGGGYPGYHYFIGPQGSPRALAFTDFERRLLVHKQRYFSTLPFTYVRQTHIRWKLFGPFDNGGDLLRSFWPEHLQKSLQDSAAALSATGGTVWLWQTHYPVTSAWLPHPRQQTTWYAYTRFWSEEADTVDFLIDTKDQSKSGADATPPAGEWDYSHSRIWIDGEVVPPPRYAHAGRKSGLLEEPLVDEMYYIRPPYRIGVHKGWNTILVKLPVDQFDPLKNWQVPPKLMYTVIPVKKEKNSVNLISIGFRFQPSSDHTSK